jgi:hypothetical protein
MGDTRALATPEEVAGYLQVPPATLTIWRYKGTGPPYTPVGRHVRYAWPDVYDWIRNQTKAGGGGATQEKRGRTGRRA